MLPSQLSNKVECQNHRQAIVVSGIFEDGVKMKTKLNPSVSQGLWALLYLNFIINSEI